MCLCICVCIYICMYICIYKKSLKNIYITQIGKEEIKLSFFADDMTLYIENLKESTEKLLGLINECTKVTRQKINPQKQVVFPYTSHEQSQNEIKKATLLIIEILKYLGMKTIKEVQICTLKLKNIAEKN